MTTVAMIMTNLVNIIHLITVLVTYQIDFKIIFQLLFNPQAILDYSNIILKVIIAHMAWQDDSSAKDLLMVYLYQVYPFYT